MKKVLIASTVFLALLAGATALTAQNSYESVSPGDAVDVIKAGDGAVILDVRTPEEFTGPLGHLKGARLIPVQELERRISELEADKDKKILVVCRSGGRSAKASGILARHGFTNVVNVEQGMIGINRVPGAPIERR